MPGSLTTPGCPSTRVGVLDHIAFRYLYSVGTQDIPIAAQWLACALPCRRFVVGLAANDARLGADVDRSGRTEARTGLQMMPTSPRSPLSFRTAGFPSTAGRLAYQTGPFWYVAQLKPAPDMRCSSSSLRPSFVHFVAASMAPL